MQGAALYKVEFKPLISVLLLMIRWKTRMKVYQQSDTALLKSEVRIIMMEF